MGNRTYKNGKFFMPSGGCHFLRPLDAFLTIDFSSIGYMMSIGPPFEIGEA